MQVEVTVNYVGQFCSSWQFAHFFPARENVGELYALCQSLPPSCFPSSTFNADRLLGWKLLLWFFIFFSSLKTRPVYLVPVRFIVTAWNASCFRLRLGLSDWFIIYRSAPFDGNASAVPLDYQMVKFNLAHLNVFAALPLGCVTQLGAGTFLLFNQPTEAAQLRDKQKVMTTLHHDS